MAARCLLKVYAMTEPAPATLHELTACIYDVMALPHDAKGDGWRRVAVNAASMAAGGRINALEHMLALLDMLADDVWATADMGPSALVEHTAMRAAQVAHAAARLADDNALAARAYSLASVAPASADWIVDGWLPRGRVALIAGKGGAGKSRLALQLAAGIVGDVPDWLPDVALPIAPDVRGATVVLATYEDAPELLADRADRLKRGITATGRHRWPALADLTDLHVIDLAREGPIWGPPKGVHVATRAALLPTGDRLREHCETVGARLLILDPLAAAFGANENDRSAVREFLSAMDGWARDADCAVLIVAHPPKNSATFSGSTDWVNGVRTAWSLARPDGDPTAPADDRAYDLLLAKANYARAGLTVTLLADWSRGGWHWRARPEVAPTAPADDRHGY